MTELKPGRGLSGAPMGAPVRARLPFLEPDATEPARADAPPRSAHTTMPAGAAQIRRRSWLKLSALLVIGLPTLLTAVYYAVLAAPQYAVEARFAVRGASGQSSGSDLLGIFTGGKSSNSTIADAYIVMDFIHSRELVDKLRPGLDIRKLYSRPSADRLARLDPGSPIEDVVEYWRRMIDLGFDSGAQIITFKVRAFTPQDAKQLADAVIGQSETLINGLSERARQDSVKYAQLEVEQSERRLKMHRTAVRDFRSARQEIDPIKTAEAQLAQIARLDQELTAAKAQMDTLLKYMKPDAPNVTFLSSKVATLEQQLVEERRRLGPGSTALGTIGNSSLSGAVGQYEELVVEREFAEKAYVSALASLERARLEALQQQRYLATFVPPKLPEYALYPKRVLNTLTVLGGAFVLWALGVLMAYSIRDHAV